MNEKNNATETVEVPLPIKAEYGSGILKVRFANNVERYLKIPQALDASLGTEINPLNWFPQAVPINEDGSIMVHDTSYSAAELWDQGVLSVDFRWFPF